MSQFQDKWIPSILKKMYSDSGFFNVFGFGSTKIKRIWIRRDIDISQLCSATLAKIVKWL